MEEKRLPDENVEGGGSETWSKEEEGGDSEGGRSGREKMIGRENTSRGII